MSAPPAPAALRLRFPFRTEEEFLAGYGSNLGRGGMFVATKALKPEGTALTFELVLAGGERLLVGEGVVVKSQIDEGGARAGMTVRFTRLDAAGKQLVERAVNLRFGPPRETSTAAPSTPPVAKSVAPPAGSASDVDGTFRPGAAAQETAARSGEDAVPAARNPFPAGPATLRPLFLSDDEADEGAARSADAGEGTTQSEPQIAAAPHVDAGTHGSTAVREPPPETSAASAAHDSPPTGREFGAAPVAATAEENPVAPGSRDNSARPAMELASFGGQVEPEPPAATESVGTGRQGARERLAAMLARDSAPVAAPVTPSGLFGVVLGNAPLVMRWSKDHATVQELVSDEQLHQVLGGRAESAARAVCVVPARLSAGAREAALRSLSANHVDPWRLIARTSALAFAYASGKSLARQRVLLLDFDDEALEAALGVITGDDVEILALESTRAGGTKALDEQIAADLSRATGLALDATLQQEAWRVRYALSAQPEATLQLGGANVRISRDGVQKAIEAWLQAVGATIATVLSRARTEASALDARVGAGAVVEADWLRMLLESQVRGALLAHGSSELARGAAQFAHALDERSRGKRTGQVSELLGSPVLMLARAGALAPVLDAGTRLPAEKTIAVPVSAGAQVAVHLFDQAKLEADAWIGGALLESRDRGELTLRVLVNENGCVRLEARRPASERQPAELSRSRDYQGDIALAPELSVPGQPTETSRWGGLKKLFGRKS